jgi:hypothetical protein
MQYCPFLERETWTLWNDKMHMPRPMTLLFSYLQKPSHRDSESYLHGHVFT